MQLYLKVLKYLKPLWHFIVLSIIFSLFYIGFHSLSLWIAVDFIKELFDPTQTQIEQTAEDNRTSKLSDNPVAQMQQEKHMKNENDNVDDSLLSLKRKFNLYNKINNGIKQIIIQDDKYKTLRTVCIAMFLTFFFKNIFSYLKGVVGNLILLRVTVNVRNQLYEKLVRLPLTYFENKRSGELTSIVFNDVSAINQVLSSSFGKMIEAPLQIIIFFALLIIMNWKLSLFTFVLIPISGLLIVKIGQSIRRKNKRSLRQIANLLSAFHEVITSIKIVKAFTSEKKETERLHNYNATWFYLNFRMTKLKYLLSPLNETIAVCMLAVLLWYGGNMVYQGTGMNAEDFIRYLAFLFMTFQPLKDISDVNNKVQSGMAAAERIFSVMDAEPEKYRNPESKILSAFYKNIQYSRVRFQYNKNLPPVLDEIDLDIQKGETVALVGPSGAGKTTLVNLLPRFYEIDHGRIMVDGQNIQEIDLISLRQKIGLVTQDTILFNETVRDNIAYRVPADDHAVIHASKVANAWEFIEKLDRGLDTIIGERGVKLSGGQKQRLSIARAILKNPPILILDEATSALDTESERLVQEAIDKLMKNRTVLVIAHRLSTVINADKIIVMQKGKIVGQGKHRDLLKSCKLYKMLHKMQFQSGIEDV